MRSLTKKALESIVGAQGIFGGLLAKQVGEFMLDCEPEVQGWVEGVGSERNEFKP